MTIVEYGLLVVIKFTTLADCEEIKHMIGHEAHCFMSYRELMVDEHPKPLARPFTAEDLDKVIAQ